MLRAAAPRAWPPAPPSLWVNRPEFALLWILKADESLVRLPFVSLDAPPQATPVFFRCSRHLVVLAVKCFLDNLWQLNVFQASNRVVVVVPPQKVRGCGSISLKMNGNW